MFKDFFGGSFGGNKGGGFRNSRRKPGKGRSGSRRKGGINRGLGFMSDIFEGVVRGVGQRLQGFPRF